MATEAATINALHETSWRGSLVFSGGGSQLIGMLSEQPGASSTLLEASVPYAREALVEYIGEEPEQYCAPATARAMAVQAFRRSLAYGDDAKHLFGFGCCASLRSKQVKKGRRRVHMALQTVNETICWSLTLNNLNNQDASRAQEERLAALLGLDLLAEGLRLEKTAFADVGEARLESQCFRAPATWQRILTGEDKLAAHPEAPPDTVNEAARCLLFSGSFNPFHQGHLEIAKDAKQRTGLSLEYELCVNNPDKSALDYQEIDARLSSMPKGSRIWLTALPTFLEKCRHFSNTTFVVGIDTLTRILDPSYYGREAQDATALSSQFRQAGCDFLVYGRFSNGMFDGLADCEMPDDFRSLCTSVDEAEFRVDVSSTSIRAAKNQP